MARIGVIGIGSIGSVLAYGLDRIGHDVAINDVDEDVVQRSQYPQRSKPELARRADLVVVVVPTPSDETGGVTTYVRDALAELTSVDAVMPTIVLRSTMPPGSTGRLADEFDEPLVYSPEFLRDRSGAADFFSPDRIVLAGPEPEREHAKDVFATGLGTRRSACPIIERDDYVTAELGKYAHNAFFATKVSFANQMRLIAGAAGADAETVMDIVTADARNTSSHLDPTMGAYSGECLPKDMQALRMFAKQEADAPTPQLDGTVEVNELARELFVYTDIADVDADGAGRGEVAPR